MQLLKKTITDVLKNKMSSTSGRSSKCLWDIIITLKTADGFLFLLRFVSHKLAVVQKPTDET